MYFIIIIIIITIIVIFFTQHVCPGISKIAERASSWSDH